MLIREGEQTSESEVSLDKETLVINHWLDNCQNDHADCASIESGFMLTRVVDVSDTENQKPRFEYYSLPIPGIKPLLGIDNAPNSHHYFVQSS